MTDNCHWFSNYIIAMLMHELCNNVVAEPMTIDLEQTRFSFKKKTYCTQAHSDRQL